jgi:hypothetical protein
MEKNGEGLIIKEDYKYKGTIQNGKKNKKGKIYYKNGNKYYGEFENDIKNGIGILLYNNNEIYEGEIKNEKIEGK